jgi:hypothetical protein
MIEICGGINPSQLAFLNATDPFVLFCGGVGSGKSTAAQIKALMLKGANGKLPGLLMAETLGELMSNIVDPLIEMLEQQLPHRMVPVVHTDNKGRRELRFADGGIVYLRSADSIKSYAGLNVAWLVGDEPWLWTHRAYLKAIERVRLKSAKMLQRAFSSTPAMNYLADEFNTGRKYRRTIPASTYENKDNLAPGYIEGLLESYSTRMARAMIYGEWTVLTGAVYEAFDPRPESLWLLPYDPKDYEHRKTYLAIDPGFQRSAILWIHEIAPTEWIVFDEIMADHTSDDALVQMINDRGWPVDEIWCDPAADQTQSAMSLDTIDMLREVKRRRKYTGAIRYITGPYRRITYGVDKVRVLLGDPDRGQPIRVYFAKHLLEQEQNMDRGIVKDLSRYRYGEVKDDKPVTDVPMKDGKTDHGCDAFRYFGVGAWLTSPLRQKDP